MRIITNTVLLGILLSTMACATQRRSVTHIRVDKDKAYLAYAEWDQGMLTGITGSNDRSRVKRCVINTDNTLKCEEDADVNRILNPQEDNGPAPAPQSATPPAEAAPAEAAPAEAPAEATPPKS